ncbi:MAG: cupin domain-containing protein, partial [Chloroflexi bacterium]|nr:cupin domain-containing protein [Chloroflexota bacterium]
MNQQFADLQELDAWLTERNLGGMWQRHRFGDQQLKPQHWKWADVSQGLRSAADLVPMDMVAMRTVQLRNPNNPAGITQTLHFSAQCLMPGERTRPHRNLVGETRFVLKAPPGAIFVIDGEAFPMECGDLITTPNWAWHDHYNGGSEPAIWLDGMDTRLVNALGKSINEPFPEPHQSVTKPEGFSHRTLGHVRSSSAQPTLQPPPFRYPWAET